MKKVTAVAEESVGHRGRTIKRFNIIVIRTLIFRIITHDTYVQGNLSKEEEKNKFKPIYQQLRDRKEIPLRVQGN